MSQMKQQKKSQKIPIFWRRFSSWKAEKLNAKAAEGRNTQYKNVFLVEKEYF